jgi:1,4-dihydroxy-2-naphthoate octaprenyltransferase
VPVGLLVAAILHANDFRDIEDDSRAGIKTSSIVGGRVFATVEYYFMLIGSYVSVVIMVMLKVLSPWSLLVLLTLPIALKLMKIIKPGVDSKNPALAMADVQTAQFHFLFGVILSVSLILHKFIA